MVWLERFWKSELPTISQICKTPKPFAKAARIRKTSSQTHPDVKLKVMARSISTLALLLTSSNQPLRGGKGQLYEGGIRVPFMMQSPAMLPASKIDTQPVISLDLAATILGTLPPGQ